ncbi:hypothetical protein ACJ41O_010577 [Fusarium nematophilum]
MPSSPSPSRKAPFTQEDPIYLSCDLDVIDEVRSINSDEVIDEVRSIDSDSTGYETAEEQGPCDGSSQNASQAHPADSLQHRIRQLTPEPKGKGESHAPKKAPVKKRFPGKLNKSEFQHVQLEPGKEKEKGDAHDFVVVEDGDSLDKEVEG